MKKKLLTLAFTLVLLVGLVAAMGMNASAADQAIKSCVEVDSWEDLYDFLQQSPAGFTAILTEDIVERQDNYGFEFPVISAAGTIVIDMNGHDIDIMSDSTEYLFKVGGNYATKLHIVNTKDEGGSIILNSKYTGAHIIDIAQKDSEVHLYAGVTLAMGTHGKYFNDHVDGTTAAIDAMSFKTIGIHGAYIENFMARGVAIDFCNLDNYAHNSSWVYIDGASVIRSKYRGLYCFNDTTTPNLCLSECTFDYQPSVPTGGQNYITEEQYSAFDFRSLGAAFKDITRYSAYKVYYADAANANASKTAVDSNKTLGSYQGKKIMVVPSDCPHNATTLLNYLAANDGQPGEAHYRACAVCMKFMSNAVCTYVDAKPATCVAPGYSRGGLDCECGLKTAVVEATKEHEYKLISKRDSTCSSIGYSTDIYLCESCGGKFDSNKVELTPVQLGKIVIPKKSHDYRDILTKKASLTSDGVIVNACTGCEDVQSAVSVMKIKSVTLSQTEYVHDGKNKTPKVTVTDANGKKLVKNVDYKTSVASKRSGIGKYTVTVTFIGNYEGTKKVYFTILPGKPATVKSASQTTSSVKLSWSKVSGAVGYTVYRYSPSKKAYVKAGTTEGTTFTVKSLYSATEYTFKVVAYGKTSGGKVYDSASYALLKSGTMPAKPSSVKSASQTTSSIKLSWSAVTRATGYNVYRYSPSKKAYVKAGSTTGTSYTVKSLYDGTKYTFRVVPYFKTSDGTIIESSSYALLKTATKTATPTLSKVTTTKGKATLTHTDVSGETGYTVYYSTKKDSGFKKYDNFKANTKTATVSGLTSGKTYYFKVRTYITTDSGYVYSAWSTVKSVKVK